MRLPKPLRQLLRATPFRWALLVAAAFAVCTLVLFGFFYWQTCMYVTANIDGAIVEEAHLISGDPPDVGHQAVLAAIGRRLRDDPRRIKLAGLFAADGKRIAGNVEALPASLPLDGSAHATSVMRVAAGGREPQVVRAVGIRLTSGDILVIGRDAQEVHQTAAIVSRALALGVVPATCLALLAGALLSLRAQRRIEAVGRQASRIVAGELQQRLPVRRGGDPLIGWAPSSTGCSTRSRRWCAALGASARTSRTISTHAADAGAGDAGAGATRRVLWGSCRR